MTFPPSSPQQYAAPIRVRGARTHNLRSVDVDVPKHALTVFTGVSGSGKSSLALGTIAARSQSIVADTYPTFVRARLPRSPQPDVDAMENLTFTALIDQKRFTGNSRSTVATATDLAPLIRLIFSRLGEPHAGFSPAYSFNDPRGACPRCEGLGTVVDVDLDELLDLERTINEGPVRFSVFRPGVYRWGRFAYNGMFDRDKPLRDFTEEEMHTFLYADGIRPENPEPKYPRTAKFHGLVNVVRKLYVTSDAASPSPQVEKELERILKAGECPECHGARVNEAARASLIEGRSIVDWTAMSITELAGVVEELDAPEVGPALEGLKTGLASLLSVGLGYLTLDRTSSTLSGGEAQRVKVVRHLGSALSDATYVFDEPSVGLHPADVQRLIDLLHRLRDGGNTVLVVEHDQQIIRAADHVIDIGPGAGSAGGTIRFTGTPAELAQTDTLTGRLLGERLVLPEAPRADAGSVRIESAHDHNLQGVSAEVPLGQLTAIVGVAGSGKSSLATLALPGQHPEFTVVGQDPLHGGVRSTMLSLLGIADEVRDVFARASGKDRSWFSFNAKGACPTCKGKGFITTELAFLDDVATPCEACGGRRFNPTALSVEVDGRTIADVLESVPADVASLLPELAPTFDWVRRVGLGYMPVGRSLDTFSGGERQRLLLARHLATSATLAGQRIVLDEPTTGLHPSDVGVLNALFDDLLEEGATLVVVEHNLRVIARADHIIEIGPGAGSDGGRVVAAGTPAQVARVEGSPTGAALARAARA